MGTSTNGIIAFGIAFEEDTEFPWDADQFDGDVEDWWMEHCGFQNKYSPFTESGDYAEGWSENDPRFEEYFSLSRKWLSENPVPFQAENYCSGECPMYALVLPGKTMTSLRGCPTPFVPSDLTIDGKAVQRFKAALAQAGIAVESEPEWLLMSYWG